MGWECLKISCEVIHVPWGDLWLQLRTTVILSICGGFLVGSFPSPPPELYVHPVLHFTIIFLSIPEKTKLLSWVFYRLTRILQYLLASLATMTRTARRLCSAISSSGMTLTMGHSGEGGENQCSRLRCSGMLFTFLGELGSSATGRQQPGKAQR